MIQKCPNCGKEHVPYKHNFLEFWDGKTYHCSFCKFIFTNEDTGIKKQSKLF